MLRETKRRDAGLHGWLKQRSEFFAEIDAALQKSVGGVMADYYLFLVKNCPGKNAADPGVIALVCTTGATVVTEEAVDQSARDPKIPPVCRDYGVSWVRLLEVLRTEG